MSKREKHPRAAKKAINYREESELDVEVVVVDRVDVDYVPCVRKRRIKMEGGDSVEQEREAEGVGSVGLDGTMRTYVGSREAPTTEFMHSGGDRGSSDLVSTACQSLFYRSLL